MRMPFELVLGRGDERGPDLPRGRLRRDDVHSRRAILRGPCEAPGRRRAPGPGRAGGEGGQRPRRRRESSGASPTDELPVGDRFVVRPGEKLADRRRRRGRALRDRQVAADRREHAGRGRSRRRGDRRDGQRRRHASSCARPGSARTRRSRRSRGSSTDAQSGKAPVQRLADRVSAVFVPVVIALAVATLTFWLLAGDGRRSPSRPRSPC